MCRWLQGWNAIVNRRIDEWMIAQGRVHSNADEGNSRRAAVPAPPSPVATVYQHSTTRCWQWTLGYCSPSGGLASNSAIVHVSNHGVERIERMWRREMRVRRWTAPDKVTPRITTLAWNRGTHPGGFYYAWCSCRLPRTFHSSSWAAKWIRF